MGVNGQGHLSVSFLRRSMCAEGMREEVGRWVPRGTGTASGHQGVS